MISRYIALILSCLGIFSAVALATKMGTPPPASKMVQDPVKNPFSAAFSASGIIEAMGDLVAVGIQESGIIAEVYKGISEKVKKGEPLLRLDTYELEAEKKARLAAVMVAKSKLMRLEDQLARLKSIEDLRAISLNDMKTKEFDVKIAEAELEEASARLHFIEAKIERMTLVAPQDGTVLQRKAKVGEFLSPQSKEPPFILGDLTALQIRADIDEQSASWLTSCAKAVAFPKNRPDKSLPLKFVCIEPYVVPKKSLTGSGNERVDTRVLQVIFTAEPPQDFFLYVGQQVDLYIEREAPL